MQPTLKHLMVGTAAALLAAGCSATGTAPAPAPASAPAAGTSSAEAAPSAPSSAATGTAPGGGTSTSVSIYGCDQQPVAQPKTYLLACGDAGLALDQLVWSGWGKAQATATGVQTQNSCVPTCAAGSPISTRATATLSGLSAGHYTELHVDTPKGAADYTISTMGPLAAG